MIQIKSRYTGSVIKELNVKTLKGADLKGADLAGANLAGANLRGAENIYIFNKEGGRICYAVKHGDGLKVKAGCFWGTLQEFEVKCKETYPNNTIEAYEAQIQYLKLLKL